MSPTTPNPHRRKPRKSSAGRKRAYVLIGVHVLFAIHLAQWLATGSTITPVEPSEAREALDTGAVNFGAIFFVVAILSTVVLGRWFCGWGCHIVALQDACGALMRKAGVRPRLFRTRTLVAVPYLVGFYLFLWPATYRAFLEEPLKEHLPDVISFLGLGASPRFEGLHLEVMRDDFWLTFPGVGIAITTFIVCGFLAVYLLGAKGFCTYGCPYGAFFAVADRVSPARIQADLSKCESCGHCTAHCTSNVEIHKEIQVHERVVDTGCMKCMDCVSVCPTGALSFGFGRPALGSKARHPEALKVRRYDTTLLGEIGLWIVGFTAYYAFHGAYGAGYFPLLLAVGMAGCYGFLAFTALRAFTKPHVTVANLAVRRRGQLTGSGYLVLAAFILSTLFVGHCLYMKRQIDASNRQLTQVRQAAWKGLEPTAEEAKIGAELVDRYEKVVPFWRGGLGLIANPMVHFHLAQSAALTGDLDRAIREIDIARASTTTDILTGIRARFVERRDGRDAAEAFLRQEISANPQFHASRYELIQILDESNRIDAATEFALRGLELKPDDSNLLARAARGLLQRGETARAIEMLETGVERGTNTAPLVLLLAQHDLQSGRADDAVARFENAIEHDPDDLAHRMNFIALLTQLRDVGRAAQQYEAAIERHPDNLVLLRTYCGFLIATGRGTEAIPQLEKVATELDTADPAPAEVLEGLYREIGRSEEAEKWRAEKERRAALRE